VQLSAEHPDILTANIWITIGFTYDTNRRKYCLVKSKNDSGLCLACTSALHPKIHAFCYRCKAPNPPDWTTGNESLDLLIMRSWNNAKQYNDSYIQWVNYSRLTNIEQASALNFECTHTADWSQATYGGDQLIKVTLKKIVEGQNSQSFDFSQVKTCYFVYKPSIHSNVIV